MADWSLRKTETLATKTIDTCLLTKALKLVSLLRKQEAGEDFEPSNFIGIRLEFEQWLNLVL